MDFLLAAVLLGLLTVGHSTPLSIVTQFPRTEDDVFREAVTDGFIVDQHFLSSLTTQAPQRDTTLQFSTTTTTQTPDSGEGTSEGESPNVSTTIFFTSTTWTSVESDSSSSASQRSLSEQTTTTAVALSSEGPSIFPENEGSGSGFGSGFGSGSEKESRSEINEGFLTALDTALLERPEEPVLVHQPQQTITPMPKGHVTPDWIIILTFVVAIAALVLLCLAIATRDKWNRPNQSNVTIKTLAPAQQRKVESEKFLREEHPKENGKAEEYTVIPLEELPDSYSS